MTQRCGGALCLLVLLTGCSKIVVVKLYPPPPPPAVTSQLPLAKGILYALPKTIISVQVKVDKTERKGAPFAIYAGIFAPGTTPVCEEGSCIKEGSKTYSVEDGATFSSYGVPDPNQVYLVKFFGAGSVDQALSMNWNEAGLLSSASSTVTNRTTDNIMSGINVAAGIAGKVAFGKTVPAPGVTNDCAALVYGAEAGPHDAEFKKEIDSLTQSAPAVLPHPAIPAKFPNMDAQLQQALFASYCSIDSKNRKNIPLDQDLFEAALRAYLDQIYPLVQTEETLLRAKNVLFDPVALLSRVQAEIVTRLTPLFLGTKKVATWNTTLDVRKIEEGRAMPATLVLFKLDPTHGITLVDADLPVDATRMPEDFNNKASGGKDYVLKVDYYPPQSNQLFTRVDDDVKGERSFRYRMPAQISVDLVDDAKSYGSGKLFIAQLGKVISLPASRHSKSLTYTLALVEATGGLKAFTLGTTGGLDAATITSLGSSTSTLLDAKNAAAAKAATAADPATALTKQDSILKLQDDICTIQKKYNLPCTIQPQ